MEKHDNGGSLEYVPRGSEPMLNFQSEVPKDEKEHERI